MNHLECQKRRKQLSYVCNKTLKVPRADSPGLSVGTSFQASMHSPFMVSLNQSEKLCMVINQSAGPYVPNLMIKCKDIKGFPLDNMTHLREGLLAQH